MRKPASYLVSEVLRAGRRRSGLRALFALCLLALTACSSASQGSANSADNLIQSSPSIPNDSINGAPRPDSTSELISGDDSFLERASEEIDAYVFLVKKYNPGLCYGMPTVTSDLIATTEVANSPRLAVFIRETFGSQSDFQIFTRIRQLLAIELRRESGEAYEYFLPDGKCCDIIRFHGRLHLREGVFLDSLLERSVENVPC